MRAVCLVLLAVSLSGQDAAEIVRQSISLDANNVDRLRNYTFIEHSQTRYLDKDGKTTKTESETEEILILGGRPYGKTIAKNGRSLSGRDAEKEQAKLDKEAAKRQAETPKEKARREKERAERRQFLREIPEAFNLRLLGTEAISGKPAWVIEATPKPGYRPRNKDAKVFTKVRAKLWVDQSEYQWVKAEADVLDTLSFGWGLLRVSPGSTLQFLQMRMNDEVWVPQKVALHADARLGYLKKLRAELQVDYRDYKKFQSESRLLDTEPVEAVK